MRMNVQPIPGVPDKINEVRNLTAQIVNKEVLPNENFLWAWQADGRFRESDVGRARELRDEIKAKVKQAGLWAPHLPSEYGGAGLDFLEHAYMNEVLAYAIGAASLFGVVAPNSGNQTILLKYGTEEQKQKWLLPLIEGTMESGFSMTEPDQPGSDPRSIKTTAARDGDEWVINGHKWFTSNGKRADFFIVMCRTEDCDGARRRQRPDDADHRAAGHAGREHRPRHSGLGSGQRSLRDHLRQRARAGRQSARRHRHGPPGGAGPARRGAHLPLHELGRADVARVRPDGGARDDARGARRPARDQAVHPGLHRRLLHRHPGGAPDDHPLRAEKMDSRGDPRTDISAIKIFVPAAYHRVVDRAIQVWGAAGVSGDLPLAAHVPGRAHAAPRRRPGRGAQDPDREERAQAVPRRRGLGLRELGDDLKK